MTPERIRRHDHERLYQPRIHSRRIRELHRLSEETGEPMTVLVDQALQMFIERRSSDDNQIDSEAHGGEQDE
jgi:HPt (histidine-containing phosphotransfer) domain-containing protein